MTAARREASLVALAVVVICCFRRPDAFFSPQFFVEDGTVFFKDSFELGVRSVLKPYNGYLHLIPRSVAWLSKLTPLEWRPAFFAYASLAISVALALYVLRARFDAAPRWPLALAPFVVPISAFMYMSLSSVQWLAALFLVVVLLQRAPQTRQEWIIDGIAVGFAGLTGPFSIVIAALWPLRCRLLGFGKNERWMGTLLALTACVQLGVLLHDGQMERSGFQDLHWSVLSQHAATFLFGASVPAQFPAAGLLAMVALIIGSVRCFSGLDAPARHVATLLLGATAAFIALGLYRMGDTAHDANAFTAGVHYFFLPHVLLTFFFLVALHGASSGRNVARAFILLLLLSSASSFSMQRPYDFHWSRYCNLIRSGKSVGVPINWPGWYIPLNTEPMR